MEPNAIDLVIYLFGISIFILIVVMYLVWTNPDEDKLLQDEEHIKDTSKRNGLNTDEMNK